MTSWRPLLAGVLRREDDAVLVVTATREVRVAGDPDVVAAVLQRCDGRRTEAEVVAALPADEQPGARELLGALREHAALVDCTQAWRVLEEQTSAGSPFYPAPDAGALDELTRRRWRPATTGVAHALTPAPTAVAKLAARRASAEPGGAEHVVSFPELSAILTAGYAAPAGAARAPVASAGALYPLVIHVLVRRDIGPLSPGAWWYDRDAGDAGDLLRVRDGVPVLDELLLSHELSDAMLARGEPVLVLSADIARGSGKYGNRAHRYALLEAGAVLQNVTLAATELGVPLRPIGGFDEGRMALLLDLAGAQPLLTVLLGA